MLKFLSLLKAKQMRLKLTVLVSLACAIAIFAVVRTSSKMQATRVPEKNRLQWYAKNAKEEGKQRVVLPGPKLDYAGVNMDLDDALRAYSVVVATPIESKSEIQNSDDIWTWYKFRILELITRKNSIYCDTCPPVPNPPAAMSADTPEEFLIVTSGGTVMLDGVAMTIENREIPPFEQGKKYVLLISFEPSGVASLGTGPSSVFRLTDDGSMASVNNSNWKIQTQISRRFNLKFSALKSHLKN